MVNKCRWAGGVGLTGIAMLGLFLSAPARSQPIRLKMETPVVMQPVLPKTGDGTTLSAQFSGIKLGENSNFRQYLNVARDCIKDKAWQDAVTALQTILDNKEDFFAQVTEVGPDGKKAQRWTSVKFEANNLLGSMPEQGLDVYEQRFGAPAQNKLVEAKSTGSRELLAEVAQRFLHTKAGIEANDLLATYFMDRGQFFMAALRFEKLFAMNPDRVKIDDMTLFKAALAYRRAGDLKHADAVWRKLEPRLREQGGLKIGADLAATATLQQFMDETPRPESASPFDWPYVRGNVSNSAQAQGSPPLLDVVLFRRDTIKEKADDGEDEKGTEAKIKIDVAIAQQNGFANTPILPGFFPIASNNLLVYRSYHDARAVYLQDEKDATGKVINKAGSIAWKTTDFDGALANVLAEGKTRIVLENWLTRFYGTHGLSSLVYENTLNGTLSTDHRNVYAIDDLAVPAPVDQFMPQIWNSGQPGQDVKTLVMQNTLYAFNLRQGNCLWRLGGGGKDDPFTDSHFLGVPISVGGKLYVLNEKYTGPNSDSELRLVCIDPYKLAGPGRPTVIEPIQALGNVVQQSRITHDVNRRLNAVHLGYGEGILVCPTNAGEILGVDLLSRSLAWAYPYREQMPATVPFLSMAAQPFPRPQPVFAGSSAANWHSAPPVIQEGKVVFTAPDANSVHCINLRDGTPVWKKKQAENDLYLAGVFNGKVLIVGKTAVRALSLQDGRQLWYLPTGDLPSGQGVASKNVYYLPLKKGEVMALDIDKGQVKAHNRAKSAGVSPGNLVFYEGAVISQTPTQIMAYPQLEARLQLAGDTLKADPDNPAKLIDHGELLLADGQLQGAVNDLERALAKKPAEPLQGRAKRKLYEALTDLLAVDFGNAGNRYLDEYRALCQVPDNEKEQQQRQARYFRIVGQGREAQGKLVEAFQMYREFGALPLHREQGGIASLDDPSHKVPTNVWLRGRVSAMIAKATPEQRAPLELKIAEEWQAVEAKKDLGAIRAFVDMFDVPFAVGREARLRLAEIMVENNDRPNFLAAELNLYQLRGAAFKDDAKWGGRALATLARLEEKKGTASSMKLAAAYYRELNRAFGTVAVRMEKGASRTGSDLFNELAADPRFRPYLEEPASPWGNAKIACREIPGGLVNTSQHGFIFQPEGDLTPLMQRSRLVLDAANFQNPQLRLLDLADNSVRWTQTLGSVPQNALYFQYLSPQGQANSAYSPSAKFRYYQVKGNLIVFQVGTVVYALDADNGKMLWQQNLLESGNMGLPSAQPGLVLSQITPDHDGYLDLIMVSQFTNQRSRTPVGHVGAVEAAYVALVTQKGLMVVDPIHGALLWKKTDVPASTRVFGDEDYVYLVDTSDGSAGSGRILRAGDGMEISAADFGAIYQNRVKVAGRRILAALPGREHLVLKLYDIPLGKDVWSKSFDPKAIILRTEDADLAGVLEPDGNVSAFDVNTGVQLLKGNVIHGRVTAEDISGVKEPLLLRDQDRFYVALNKPIEPTKVNRGFVANNFSNGLRCATVNGWFVALHRQDGRRHSGTKSISWKAGDFDWHSYMPLQNQMVVLDQFEQLPVVLLSARANELSNGGVNGIQWVSTTQSIDKRTGKMVYDPGPKSSNALRQPNSAAPQFAAFTVDLKNATINMIGYQGTLQHYIDDGRTPADVPGMSKAAAASLDPARRKTNAYGVLPGPAPGGVGLMPAFPINDQMPIRRVPIRVQPVQKD